MSGSVGAGETITFTEIPYTWKVPGQYMEVKAAVNENAVLAFPAYGLVMGQMYTAGGNAGTAMPGVTYQVNSGPQANALFGTGSVLAKMIWKWLRANPYTPLDAVGFADAAGSAKAAGTVTIGGAATAAGTLAVYFGGVRVPVAVNQGDTSAVIAANLQAAIVLQNATSGYTPLPSLTSTYTAASSVVNLLAAHGGTLGNQIDVRINYQRGDATPPGVTVTIAPMAGGATDPAATIASFLAGVSFWYTDVAFAWTDTTNIGVFSNWLVQRYGGMVKLDAHGYVAVSGTYGTVQTFLPNCKFLSAMAMQNPVMPSWEVAASMAGVCCYSAAQQPALQMRSVPLPGVLPPASADIFSPAAREVLLMAGLSTFTVDNTNNVYLERVTTTFRIDPGTNVVDSNYFDLQDAKVPTRVRYDWNGYIGQLYPRNTLTNDGTIAAAYDPNAVTPGRLKASWTGRCAVYEQNGWIQNSQVTAKASTFVIDANDGNRVNSRQQIQVMGNLMVLAGSLEFISNN
jgi:phage tail sheath gpL-like